MTRASLAVLALAVAGTALAQSDDPAALRREVEELKARVAAIEKRVGESPPERASERSAWFKVSSGMTQADVRKLLGEPARAFELDGSRVWYYMYPGGGAGSVFFDSAGRASSFQRPSGAQSAN